MENNGQKVIELDIRGQICPSTLLIALKAMNNHRSEILDGTLRLVFLTDNRDATVTIPDSAMNMGYPATVEKNEGHYLIIIGNEFW
jgi:TusA-related sulfurtransferase